MLEFTVQARGRLLTLANGPGYNDLLDLMERVCIIEETELLKLDRAKGATAEQVTSKQDQCRAIRTYFELMQREVQLQCRAFVEGQGGRANVESAALQNRLPSNEEVLGVLSVPAGNQGDAG